jgi:hypothetical protein
MSMGSPRSWYSITWIRYTVFLPSKYFPLLRLWRKPLAVRKKLLTHHWRIVKPGTVPGLKLQLSGMIYITRRSEIHPFCPSQQLRKRISGFARICRADPVTEWMKAELNFSWLIKLMNWSIIKLMDWSCSVMSYVL